MVTSLVKEKVRRPRKDKEKTGPEEVVETSDSSWQRFQKRFPHLATELEDSQSSVPISGVRWEETERTSTDSSSSVRFSGYSPDVIDFLRRCETEEQALEIIAYMEKQKEIDSAHAESLRHQLRTRGLKSFGPRKTWGYYERER